MPLASGVRKRWDGRRTGATFALSKVPIGAGPPSALQSEIMVALWEGAKRTQNSEGNGSVCDQFTNDMSWAPAVSWLCPETLGAMMHKVCLTVFKLLAVNDPHSTERQ